MMSVDIRADELSETITKMLGKPFGRFTRGPETYDCLGVVLDLFDRLAGIRIEHPFLEDPPDLVSFWRLWDQLEDPWGLRPLDVLYSHHGNGQAHVAAVENERWAVTAEDPIGVVRNRLADEKRKALSAFRLKELA